MTESPSRDRLHLLETFRNLFYTPIYVAVGGGFLYREGFDVQFGTAPPEQLAIDLLKSSEADIIQTGLSRSLMDLDQGNDDAPLHVAEINQRDGFFLISRGPTDGWSWSQLEGSTLIPVGFTPVPLTSLKSALKINGVDINRIKLTEGLGAQEAIDAFCNGEADYIQMPNPQAQQLVDDGAGHIATAIGSALGYICYSSFAVTPAFLDATPDMVQRFVRGFYGAQRWLASADAPAVAEMVSSFFPDSTSGVLEQSIDRYKRQQTWATDPLIGEEGYTTLRDVLIDGGLVKGRHPYERLVRPEFALEVIEAA